MSRVYMGIFVVLAVGVATPGLCPAMGTRPSGVRHLGGVPYVRVDRVPGAKMSALDGGRIRISTAGHRVDLEPDSRRAVCDGRSLWLHEPLLSVGGRAYIAQADLDASVLPTLEPSAHLRSWNTGVIVLDPGHGGSDEGATGMRSTKEKDLALEVCHRVRNLLRAHGMEVRLTRDRDQCIELPERSRLAHAWMADLFVSVHFNSAGNAAASGVETYVLTFPGFRSTADIGRGDADDNVYPGQPAAAASVVLGQRIHHKLLGATEAEDRGLRRARFVVLRESICPSVLVECGFLSNSEEEAEILTPEYRQAIAEGIALGILDYLRAVNLAHAGAE